MIRSASLALAVGAGLAGAAEARPPGLAEIVAREARAAGVPVSIALGVVTVESRWNPRATGRQGEIGLGQIFCRTARGVGYRGACAGLYHPATNARFSMRYLRLALRRGGAGCAGISLYNRGHNARPVCSAYGRRVIAAAGRSR